MRSLVYFVFEGLLRSYVTCFIEDVIWIIRKWRGVYLPTDKPKIYRVVKVIGGQLKNAVQMLASAGTIEPDLYLNVAYRIALSDNLLLPEPVHVTPDSWFDHAPYWPEQSFPDQLSYHLLQPPPPH